MHPIDVQNALEGMVCLVDTREQTNTRMLARLDKIGRPIERVALPCGDYSAKFPLPGDAWYDMRGTVCIERKMSMDELCACYTWERKRFEREFERAKEAGTKLYLLIEDGSFEKAYAGNYRSKMTPDALVASILAWLARYDCQIIMCRQQTSGILIRDILYREGKERLEQMEA